MGRRQAHGKAAGTWEGGRHMFCGQAGGRGDRLDRRAGGHKFVKDIFPT
jgi:hypothetical protein